MIIYNDITLTLQFLYNNMMMIRNVIFTNSDNKFERMDS